MGIGRAGRIGIGRAGIFIELGAVHRRSTYRGRWNHARAAVALSVVGKRGQDRALCRAGWGRNGLDVNG